MPSGQPTPEPTKSFTLGGVSAEGSRLQPSTDGEPRNTDSYPNSPARIKVTEVNPPETAVNFFTYGATKETRICSPDLHRHVLSTSLDAEAVRQVAQVSSLSNSLQGPIDPIIAAAPTANGASAPGRSPYLQPLANHKRGVRSTSSVDTVGLPTPMRPLSTLTGTDVVGSVAAGVRRARRRAAAGLSEASHATYGSGSPLNTSPEPSAVAEHTDDLVSSRVSALSTLYGPPPLSPVTARWQRQPRQPPDVTSYSDGDDDDNNDEDGGWATATGPASGGGGVSEGVRYLYLSRYAPALHLPPPPAAAGASLGAAGNSSGAALPGSTHTSGASGCAAGEPSSAALTAGGGTSSQSGEEDAAIRGHLNHLLQLHHHHHQQQQEQCWPPQPPHQQPAEPQQQLRQQPAHQLHLPLPPQQQQQQQQADGGGPLPSLDRSPRAASACSVASSCIAIGGHPLAAARLHGHQRERSLPERSAAWRRGVAPTQDAGAAGLGPGGASAGAGAGGVRRALSSQAGLAASAGRPGASLPRHNVAQVGPEGLGQSMVSAGAQQEAGQGQRQGWGTGDSGGEAGESSAVDGGRISPSGPAGREPGAGGAREKPRGRRRPIYVDPELVRQYTERPPKLCTPNNASRPVTSSDFAAFKNHTVNRAGTANTLRTVLGSNAPSAGSGTSGAGAGAGAAAPEARGVTPLTALLCPSWVPPAMRARSPHLGIGGVTGSATCVPGLHVPLELDPPPRAAPPQGASASASGAASALSPAPQRHQDMLPPSFNGLPGASTAAAAAAAAGERTGTPLTTSTFGLASSVPTVAVAVQAPRGGPPPHVRCGAGELVLDVNAWLTPATAPAGELCGVFGGDDGTESVALLSRVVKGVVQCDLGWAEVTESLMFMSSVAVSNAVIRFPVPHRAILQRFAATIGGTTMVAEATARSGGGSGGSGGIELEEEDEDDDPGPGKIFTKGFGRRNHAHGPGGRAPVLRVPLGKVRGDIFVTISYIVQLESSGNTLSLTHVCNWAPSRTGWHLMTQEQLLSNDGGWYGNTGGSTSGRRGRHKPSDLYDLSFELEILSHRGLNLVSGPRHMTIKPNYDALLIQGYTQVWRPRHVTTVTFEMALAVPHRSFAILHDARKAGPDADLEPPARLGAASSYDPAASSATPPLLQQQQAQQQAAGGGGGQSRGLKLVVSTALAQLAAAGDSGGKSSYTLRSAPPSSGAILEQRPVSTRHCAAVTFVPSSHFSPAELEEVLGPEVAPGPRAQAAAIRAGLSGPPGPLPVELFIVVDCCGPAGMAAHLMQLLQTLLVLLRSLPVAEGGGGGAGGSGPSAAAGGAAGGASGVVAAATLFNVVICPAAPLPPDPDDDDGTSALWAPDMAAATVTARQSQPSPQQLQHASSTDQGSTSVGPGQEDAASAPPAWLFPNGSRPVTSESVEAAVAWISALLTDPATLVSWTQPLSTLHELLADMAWSSRPAGCRRAALLLCQQLRSRDAEGEGPGLGTAPSVSSPVGRRASGGSVSAVVTGGRNATRGSARRSAGGRRTASAAPRASGGTVNSRRGSTRGASARPRATGKQTDMDVLPVANPASQSTSRPLSRTTSQSTSRPNSRPSSRPASRPASPDRAPSPISFQGLATPGAFRRSLSFRSTSPKPFSDSQAAEAEAAALAELSRQPAGSTAATVGTSEVAVAGAGAGMDGAGGGGQPSSGPSRSGSPLEFRPRSSLVRNAQGRSAVGGGGAAASGGGGGGGGGGGTSDGVRWSNGIVSNSRAAGQSDSDPEPPPPTTTTTTTITAATRARLQLSPLRLGDAFSAASGDDEEPDHLSSAAAGPDPPDLGFPVFVVVHELTLPPSSALSAVGGTATAMYGANVPSYLMAYQLYQKHLEGLMYEQAWDEVEQLPMWYFERLAEMHGGFMQVGGSALELTSSLVLAASCAVNGRYLRQLRLVARGSVLRDQCPPQLPPALPLAEPLSLLVRLSRMQAGAALELHALWPNGRPVHIELSVDPRLRTTGQLLPVLCALSEVSVLLKGMPFVPAPPRVTAPTGAFGSAAHGHLHANANGGHAGGGGGVGVRGPAQSQSGAAASAASLAMRCSPKQLAARKRAGQRAIVFNLVTPFTAMALISMTLVSNRGLNVQTLQTTQSRPGDYRHSFVWPAPVMATLIAAAKQAQSQAQAQVQGGTASPFHTAATFTGNAAAAAASSGAAGGANGPAAAAAPPPPPSGTAALLDFPPDLAAAAMAIVAGGGPAGAPAPPLPPQPQAQPLHPSLQARSKSPPGAKAPTKPKAGKTASPPAQDAAAQGDTAAQPPQPEPSAGGGGGGSSGSVNRQPASPFAEESSGAAPSTASDSIATSSEPQDSRAAALQAAANNSSSAPDFSDPESRSRLTVTLPTELPVVVPAAPRAPAVSRAKSRQQSLALLEMSGDLAARRASALGLPPDIIAAVGPSEAASCISHRFSGSGAGSQYGGSPRPSAMEAHDLPAAAAVMTMAAATPASPHPSGPIAATATASTGCGAAAPFLSPPTSDVAQLPSSTSASPLLASSAPSQPAAPLAGPQGSQLEAAAAAAAAAAAVAAAAAAAAAVKPAAVSGPIGPPMTAAARAEAHTLTVLGRLAALQHTDGSWPAVSELEELVISNGRLLVVPVLGTPRPTTQHERNVSEAREARRRESLNAIRDQALRGVVRGPAWSTVLALALLRAKYGAHRLAWVPLETRAFAWLERKWPPASACGGISAPEAILRVSALL